MKILVINAGSSSIKFQLFAMPGDRQEARGLLERIGEPQSRLKGQIGDQPILVERPVADHAEGLRLIMDALTDSSRGGLKDVSEIGAIGHRVVHGGERFASTVVIDDDVERALEDCSNLAPLHNPPNLLGIRVARQLLPGVPQVGVFDTSFHQTMPEKAWLYAVPHDLYTQHGVRRYGFHGTSHRYVARRAAVLLGRPLKDLHLITTHLGNGASICAIEKGRSVDTSMGLTPLEGLVMGTRSGDVDPALGAYLGRVRGLDLEGVDRLLNKQSGILGLSGLSNDLRTIEEEDARGNVAARRALDVYCYRIRKYIGSYTAVLGHVDALVFTAGVGENSSTVRARSLSGMEPLGYSLDLALNQAARGREGDVASAASAKRILVIPTNEELVIAQDTFALATGLPLPD